MSDTPAVERDQERVQRFIERFAGQLVHMGLQRMPSRIFVALLSSDAGRLTAAELAEQLQVSPAAVSGGVRMLSQVDMVTREREPGTRRDTYVVNDDLWYDVITRRDAHLLRYAAVLNEGVEVLGENTPAGRRMAETLAFFEFIHREMPLMLDRWHEYRTELHRKWGLID
ncbi:MAG: MarR family transcriptional regulator [Kibdelosporangium sp.]